ncbi:hypothetical protein LINGRAHAP2_LOCUS34543 [Linum grandiflorum]
MEGDLTKPLFLKLKIEVV